MSNPCKLTQTEVSIDNYGFCKACGYELGDHAAPQPISNLPNETIESSLLNNRITEYHIAQALVKYEEEPKPKGK